MNEKSQEMTETLEKLWEQCEACDSTVCAYNVDCQCRYSMVFGYDPLSTEEDGCISGIIDW